MPVTDAITRKPWLGMRLVAGGAGLMVVTVSTLHLAPGALGAVSIALLMAYMLALFINLVLGPIVLFVAGMWFPRLIPPARRWQDWLIEEVGT